MAWAPIEGEKVNSQFGLARVLKLDRHAALILLDESGITVKVNINILVPVQSDVTKQKIISDSRIQYLNITSINEREKTVVQEKRKAVEALRFGLVPETEIESITLHYQELQSWVLSQFPDVHLARPRVAEIYGPFGSGKSHVMAVIRYIASQQGYVSARVEVNGRGVTLADPEGLLYSLWSTIKANTLNSNTPILDLCVKAINLGRPAPMIAPVGPDRVHDNYCTALLINRAGVIDNDGEDLDAVMVSSNEILASDVARTICRDAKVNASEFKVRRMIGREVKNRSYDFIETWVGYAILAKLAGYKGLVITIDEFEVERFAYADRKNLQRVNDLLDALSEYFSGETGHPIAPLSVFFATVGEEGHLGDQFVDKMVEQAGGNYYSVSVWSKDDRIELSKRIFKLYSQAFSLSQEYSLDIASAVETELDNFSMGENEFNRMYIKSYINALDSLYGPSND